MIAALLTALLVQGQSPSIPAEAPSIVAALTHETVEIREDFTGQELVLYGATRGLTIQDEIVVVLRGPEQDLRVMRKERRFGIWVNSDAMAFEDVPSYYAIASSLPLEDIATPQELYSSGVGLPYVLRAIQAASAPDDTLALETPQAPSGDLEATHPYLAAIERAGQRTALFAEAQRGVEVLDGGLFRATITLPPLTPVGNYVADVYLFRSGRVIASRSASLRVEKAGLERFVYDLAHERPWSYGLICVILAMGAGYLANVAFSRR
jgi:uncharacterized protein (TIGR02186 family)